MNAARTKDPNMEKVVADFRTAVNEAEELLNASAARGRRTRPQIQPGVSHLSGFE